MERADESDESALARALSRILASGADGPCNGFNG